MLESFGQSRNVLVREHIDKVCGFRRIAPQDLDLRFVFENAGNFVAGEEYRYPPVVTCHPFHELALGVGIRSINFV